MQPEWQSFLQRQGAVIDACAVQRFEARSTLPDDAPELFDLSPIGLLSARGTDVHAFLQGQLSNDLSPLRDGASVLTAYLSPQGRMLAVMRAVQCQDAVTLLLPEELRAALQTRLQRYILRAAVSLGCDNEHVARLGLAGSGAAALLRDTALPVPPRHEAVAAGADDCYVIRLDAGAERYLVLAPYARAMRSWPQWAAGARPTPYHRWRLYDIVAGIPSVYTATSDAFVPQMANLDLIGGVSFDKGCYPGQEIVARTHYLGRIKRRMLRLRAPPGQAEVKPGDALVSDSDDAAGVAVDAAPAPDGAQELLAVVSNSAAAATLYHLRTGGVPLQRMALPYAVDAPST